MAEYPNSLPVPKDTKGSNGTSTVVVETGIEGQDGEKDTIRPGAKKN